MSYLVLARKYRPQRFEEVVSQEHITKALSNALTSDRLAHAIHRYIGTNLKNSTGSLVTENYRCKAKRIGVIAMDVSSTYTTGLYLDQDFVRADLRNRESLDLKISGSG